MQCHYTALQYSGSSAVKYSDDSAVQCIGSGAVQYSAVTAVQCQQASALCCSAGRWPVITGGQLAICRHHSRHTHSTVEGDIVAIVSAPFVANATGLSVSRDIGL